jgi:magnesium transporter
LIFKLCRLDPGVASSPFIASVIDIVGIVIYMNVARFVLDLGAP